MFRHGLGLFVLRRGSVFIYLSAFDQNLSAEIHHLNHAACKTECGDGIHGGRCRTEFLGLVTDIEAVEQCRSLIDKVACRLPITVRYLDLLLSLVCKVLEVFWEACSFEEDRAAEETEDVEPR